MNRKNRRKIKNRTTPETTGPQVNLTSVKPVALSRLHFGTIVWAHIDFVGESKGKARPCVVYSVTGRAVTVLPATTSDRRFALECYVELDLTDTGLSRPTGVRTRPIEIDKMDLISICGAVVNHDGTRIRDAVAEFETGCGDSSKSLVAA
ncbi:MAG: hypothetical protein EXQ69_09430 [Acidimicrobiia bacterium]|nr:hypothetical protein [Acidimicrobiia bacterium]